MKQTVAHKKLSALEGVALIIALIAALLALNYVFSLIAPYIGANIASLLFWVSGGALAYLMMRRYVASFSYELGADVINLSLGQDNGFTADPLLSALYSDIFRRMQENGIAVCAAAGNADTHVAQKLHGVPLPTTDYMDYGTVSTPATCPEAVAVAAADAMT